jgi:FtsH-binding integral membrane protein
MSSNLYNSNTKVGVEATFFGKVMFFFGLAILFTGLGTYLGATQFQELFFQYPWLVWATFIAELALIFTSGIWSRKEPINKVLFILFAVLSGFTITPLMLSIMGTAGGATLVYKALFATALTFGATAVYGYTTDRDLSGMRSFLIIALIGVFVTGIISIFMPFSSTAEMIYSGIGILLFSAFTAYDFNTIKRYPEDAYIMAAIALYLDIFNLFLMILRFMSASRD